MRPLNLFLAASSFIVVGSSAQGYIKIDDFVGGYHLDTITGTGSSDFFADGLDKAHTLAGHRQTGYTVSSNPFGYTTTFEVGLAEARVTTPGPNDLSTELRISYGTFPHSALNMDLTVDTTFEIDLDTSPDGLAAEVWSVRVIDGSGRSSTNSRPGAISGGINFLRSGFSGNPNIDWSDIDFFEFRQSWSRAGSAPLVYWTTEIRAVPEPNIILVMSVFGIGFLGRKKRPRRTDDQST